MGQSPKHLEEITKYYLNHVESGTLSADEAHEAIKDESSLKGELARNKALKADSDESSEENAQYFDNLGLKK